MQPKAWRYELLIWTLCAVAFSVPFPFVFGSIALCLLAAVTIFTSDWRATWRRFIHTPALGAWVLFFLFNAASYFWSDDKATARWCIELRLCFLLMPFAVSAAHPIKYDGLQRILFFFILSVVVVALICIGSAWSVYHTAGDKEAFFYHSLVEGFEANAVYMALYAFIALLILLSGQATWYVGKNSVVRWAFALVIAVFFFLLSARTLLALFVLIPVPYSLWARWRRSHRPHAAILAGVLMAAMVIGVIGIDNPIRRRFAEFKKPNVDQAFLTSYRNVSEPFNNLTIRVFLWRVGWEVVQANKLWWIGAGVGDVHHLTNERMTALDVWDIDNVEHPSHLRNVNLHNMYLQCLVGLGIAGLLLMLVIVMSPILSAFRGDEGAMWLLYAIVIALIMCQESMLQTQAGTVPVALFSSLFWNRYQQVKMRRKVPAVKSV